MIEDVTTALQAFASTGNGFTLTLRDARFLTFKVHGNGNVTAGAVTLECCPQNTPIAPGSGSAGSDGLDGVDHDCRSRECHDRIPRGERFWYFPRADQYARNRWNRNRPGDSA
jgi:hypothetical protein